MLEEAAMLPPLLGVAMTAISGMKLSVSDALAAFATIVSLSSILYVIYLVIRSF
jgi:hypothetical protein